MNRRDVFKSLSALAAVSPLAPRKAAAQYPVPTEDCTPPFPELTSQPGVPFEFPMGPTRIRRSVTELMRPEHRAELERLREAYRQMRLLPESDPRSLVAQAHVHCYYCTGSFGFPAAVDIHGAWFFFPWHRMFLLFHERILGSLIKDPTLAIPYWDWDHPERRTFPEAYAGDGSNPLFDPIREAMPTSTPGLDYWFNQWKIDVGTALRTNTAEEFLGSPHDYFNYNGGGIESGVHGLVHLWTGQPGLQNGENGVPDMGILQTAARDPSFYAHHGNIDRLMEMWHAYPRHEYPTSALFLEQRFRFFDIQEPTPRDKRAFRWVSIAVKDVLDTRRLSYRYDSLAPPPPEPTRAAPARSTALTAPAPQNPSTRRIEIPERLADGQVPGGRLKLRLDGVEMSGGGIVRVFINLPDADDRSSSDLPNYVGFFVRVAASTGGHNHRALNVSLDVTDKLPVLQRGKAELTVTLVPLNRPSGPPKIANARIVIE